ncbi:MAG: enoyl-CoA hydratase/isomerase family protein [Marinobacter sp.]|nr:enoyl-CoA hydratase/isomerase family protein [Marinobacter sp.]
MNDAVTTQSPVVLAELDTTSGQRIGIIRLNQPKALNALSLEMIRLIHPQLERWAGDDQVVAVWLEGDGDKALCAGGDVVALYRSMTESRPGDAGTTLGEQFFTEEYALDYALHTYPKPVVVWGNGIVMGGGLGLLAAGSHRVVTETARIAMPEVSIGLYPDVGGSWFLNRMPGRTGLFLGLTGASVNASDALFVGLADRFIAHDQRDAVLAALKAADWDQPAHVVIGSCLRWFEHQSRDQRPPEVVRAHYDIIQQLTDADTLADVVARMTRYEGDDPWLQKAAATLKAGSPTTMAIVWEQTHQLRYAGLREVFDKELKISINCLTKGEFAEGVRALLIDKDKQPRWRYPNVESLDPAWVAGFFE